MSDGEHKLVRSELMAFLLGELEEAETSRIESLFLGDASLKEELEAAREELYAEYHSGAMSPERSGRFEKRFLQDALAEEKREFRAMMARNDAAPDPEPAGSPPSPRPESARPEPAPAPAPAPVVAAAPRSAAPARKVVMILAVLVVIVGAAAAVVFFRQSEPSRGHLALQGFSIRGKSQIGTLPDADLVTLELQTTGLVGYERFELALLRGDAAEHLQPERGREDALVARLDTSELSGGVYDLELRGVKPDGSSEVIAYYSVRKTP